MQREDGADPDWVSALTGTSVARAERAIEEARADQGLFRHLAREHAREKREHYGEIDAPLELHAIVRLRQPRHVVEVGVSSGVSSAYLLRALDRNGAGTLHSIDRPKPPTRSRSGHPARRSWSLPSGRAPGWAVPMALRARWDLRVGDKARVLPVLVEDLPTVDLFVYDVPHWDVDSRREFRRVDAKMPAGGVAISDHGADGDRCRALAAWGSELGAEVVGRRGTGLYAFAKPGEGS
jgi:hypothetical protein